MEEKRAETRHEKCGRNVKSREKRNKHRCSEHCKHMLHTEYKHTSRAELTGVVDAFVADLEFLFCHDFTLRY